MSNRFGYDEYSPFFDQEPPQAEIEKMLCSYDESPPYELKAYAVFAIKPRGWLYVEVSGCSCWPDYGYTHQEVCLNPNDLDRVTRGNFNLKDIIQASINRESKMKVTYTTDDGKQFDSEYEAYQHEKVLILASHLKTLVFFEQLQDDTLFDLAKALCEDEDIFDYLPLV